GCCEPQGSSHSTRTASHMLLVRPSTPRFTAPGNGHHTIAYTPGDSSMRRDAVGLVMGQEELRPRARLAHHSRQHHRPSATPNVRANGAAVGAAAVIALRVAWVASTGGQAAVLVALMGAQGDGSMDTSSGTLQAYPSTPGLYHLTTQVEGQTIYYTLRIPADYDGRTALPVILCLHFGGQPSEFYGGRFLNLIPSPGLGSLAAILVAPTTAQSGWAAPTGEAAAF